MLRTGIVAVMSGILAVAGHAPRAGGQEGPPLHVDTLHGVAVRDPARWLEDSKSARADAWIRKQDRTARGRLASLPSRDALRSLVATTAATPSFAAPIIKERGRYFISQGPSVGPQSDITLLVRDSASGGTRTLIDADAERRAGRPVRQAVPSPSGELVAYGTGGDETEWQTIRIRSVASGRDLADSLTGLHRFAPAVAWVRRPGRAGFYYTRFKFPEKGNGRPAQSGEVYYHGVGTPQTADRLVFAPGDSAILTPTARVTDDGNYLVIAVRRGTSRASSIHIMDLASSGKGSAPRELIPRDGANYVFVGNDGPVFWIATDDQAPKGRVLAVHRARPDRQDWREIVPQGPDAIDTWNFGAAAGGHLVVFYRRDAVLMAKVFDGDGTFRYEVNIPGRGSVWTGLSARTSDPDAYFTVQGVADPGTVYRLDVRSGAVAEFLRTTLPYDPAAIVTEQVFYPAPDGTRIPMYVVKRRDVPLDGKAPLWIYGYGAQRWAGAPWFQPPVAAWILDGGIWALPNVRGGAEYGENWFQAGARRNKQTGIDDYLAAVEWLIANRYTSSARVVAHTSSAGGVLVAAAVVQRPQLFGAAVLEYPVLDMLRYEHLLTGNRWTDDYGTIKDPIDFRAMLAYAPIQSIRPGTCLPPTLVTPGEHDQTAAPAHAYKFVAMLQDAQGCPERPLLLRVSWGAGHSAGATLEDAIENWVDQLAFARSALGPVREPR
jgi:prolyl oligopeptidase